MWLENYLISFDATDAARKAGYSDPVQSGYENKTRQDIADEISRRISAVAMGADEVLMRLGRYARGSLKPFLSEDGEVLWPDLGTDEAQENVDLLKKIKPKRRTGGRDEDRWTEDEIELEIHDPLRALELLGKHHKLFTDKTEHSGKIEHEDVGLSDTERLERLLALADSARKRRGGEPPAGAGGNQEG